MNLYDLLEGMGFSDELQVLIQEVRGMPQVETMLARSIHQRTLTAIRHGDFKTARQQAKLASTIDKESKLLAGVYNVISQENMSLDTLPKWLKDVVIQ
jgi:hypothetical protein